MGENKKNKGRIQISYELLEDLLFLPDNAKIINVYTNDVQEGMFNVTIASPFMPEVIEGARVPLVTMQELSGWDE